MEISFSYNYIIMYISLFSTPIYMNDYFYYNITNIKVKH